MPPRFLNRALATLAVALPLALVGAAIPTPAYAIDVPSPEGINVLPSTITGASSKLELQYALLYQAAKTPEFWESVAATKAGTATAAQTAEVAEEATSYAVPATKVGTLVKGAGVAGAAISSAEIGLQVGKAASTAFGLDVTGGLCSGGVGGQILAITSGTDCTDFFKTQSSWTPQVGKDGGTPAGQKVCATGTDGQSYCTQLIGFLTRSDGSPIECGIDTAGLYAAGLSVSYWINAAKAFPEGASTGRAAGQSYGNRDDDSQAKCNAAGFPSDLNHAGYFIFHPTDGSNKVMVPDYYTLTKSNTEVARGTVTSAPADPDVYVRCTDTFTDGTSAFADSVRKKLSAVKSGEMPSIPAVQMPGKVLQEEKCVLSDGHTEEGILDNPTTPEYQKAVTEHPDSLDGTSKLELYRDGKLCVEGDTTCADWFPDSKTNPDRYECRFGGKAVDLSECTALAPTFQPDRKPGYEYGDPKTGKPVRNPTASNPDNGSAVAPAPGSSSSNPSGSCFPNGWSAFNPVQWVVKPVGCALQAAFVPPAATVSASQVTIQNAVATSSLGSITNDLAGFGAVGIADGGCRGIPIDFHMYSLDVKSNLLAACSGDPLYAVAATTHTILSGVIVSAGLLACLRYLATIFGFSGLGRQVEVARLEGMMNRSRPE